MANIKLNSAPAKLRTVDERLMSYNIEMTEVTGGTFWMAYTPGQIAGTEPVPPLTSMADLGKLQEWYDPIDTKNERLLNLGKALGPVWVRVSGTWANKTYYNFDGKYEPGVVPEGFQNALQKDQWLSLLDYVKAVGAKLQISFANCEGIHHADEPWSPWQAAAPRVMPPSVTSMFPAVRCGSPSPATPAAVATPGAAPIWMCCVP